MREANRLEKNEILQKNQIGESRATKRSERGGKLTAARRGAAPEEAKK
ncbi:hypothetical protein HCDSEM_051 [Candidatus Hodgkinia cicadicola Dsem]|nr:hypothetical protein HCDSEM_051 [Candidatus Hodgkinia cicadicola Dsem]